MLFAFICDDTQTFKGIDYTHLMPSLDFMFDSLNDGLEVRIVPFGSIPDGYTEA